MGPTEAAEGVAEPVPSERAALPATPAERLGGRLARGAVIEATGFGTQQLIRFGSNLVLTRLLFPAAFGLMAMLGLVLYGLIMLTDVGLLQAVVRSERGDDPAFLDTAWTIQVTRGLILWIVATLLAWPMALLFQEPLLVKMIPVGSASVFIHGLASTRVFTLRRRLRPLPIVTLETLAQIASIGTMIGLAWAGVGVWSLVFGSLVMALVLSGGSYFLPGTHRERFRMEPAARKEISQFGRWIYASSSMTFVAGRGDQFVVGKLLGAASLGLYNIGLALAEMPDALANRVMAGILYPLYAKLHNERPAELGSTYYRTRLPLDALLHTALGGLAGVAPWLITFLYDRRYLGAIPVLQILAVRTSIGLLATPCESALVATGRSELGFRRNLAVAICTFIAMPIGNALGGTQGLLWGSAVARLAALVVLWPIAARRGLLRLEREALVLLYLAVGFGMGWGLGCVLPHRH